MAFALDQSFSPRLRSLISNDMAPWIGKISPEFQQYAVGMKEVEEAKVTSKKEADKILEKYEKVSKSQRKTLAYRRKLPPASCRPCPLANSC